MSKIKEKEKAVRLRRKGFSYGEILSEVPVTKSTLSLWLREIGLAKRQKQRLTKKKRLGQQKGGRVRREQRIRLTEEIKEKAAKEIDKISYRELWMIGISLYWAEGSKERNQATSVALGNSDPELIKIFLKWLQKICKVSKEDINFRIFLHDTSATRLKEVQKYWSGVTGFSLDKFQKVTWKRNKINTKRKNIGRDYYGLLSVIVRRSTSLNRKIQGWIEGICKKC